MGDESSRELPITIGMRLPNLMFLTRPLREFLSLALSARNFDEEWIDEFGLAVTELVNNSFEHASESERHEVDLEFRIYDDRIVFKIVDEGEERLAQGDFDFADKGPPDHLADRGRGLFLISSFADSVDVRPSNNGGTEVTITKFRGGE